jgi:alpha-glucoside transport system substrate-binding protein
MIQRREYRVLSIEKTTTSPPPPSPLWRGGGKVVLLNTQYNKRRHASLLLIVILSLLLGCIPRPTPPPTPMSATIQITPTPATPSDDNRLLVIGRFTGDDEQQFLELLNRFTEATGVQTEYRGNGEVAGLLEVIIEEGQTPDIILLPKTNWLHEMAGAGAIVPLVPEVAEQVTTNFSPAWQAEVTHNGVLYGVPFDANLKSLLWYRPAPNVTPPDTLETLVAIADSRSATDAATLTITGGASWMLTDWFENVLLATAGTEVYDGLMAHTIPWTDPRVVSVAEAYVTLLESSHILDGTEGATLALDQDAFNRTFDANGVESLFWLGQGSIVSRYASVARLIPEEDYTVAPFPTDGALVVVGSLAVATNERSQTSQLLTYLAQPDSIEPWVQQGGFISPNLALPPDDYPTTVARSEAELLMDAPALRPDLSDQLPPLLGTYLGEQLREMLLRPDDIETILAEIEQVATREQGRVP